MSQLFRGMLALLLTTAMLSCAVDALQQCRDEEQSGTYLHESNNSCGCELRACPAGTRCFHGQCCDPAVERSNPNLCGCGQVCGPTELCSQGRCCNPRTDLGCACNADEHLVDDLNCGCRGTCPVGSACQGGICKCKDEDRVICNTLSRPPWGECIERNACVCKKDQHLNDFASCACAGPCGPGNLCSNGTCSCDPLAHAFDNLKCGCNAACSTNLGFVCQNGACLCDPIHLTNSKNCGCTGAVCNTAKGEECRGGACICPPERLYDSQKCNCGDPCPSGEICNNGRCIKPGL